MRVLFYPILILVVVILLGSALVLLRPESWWQSGPRTIAQMLRPSTPAKKPSPLPEPPKAKAESRPKYLASAAPAHAESAQPVEPTPAAALPERSYPFPISDQIPPGTSQSAILARFGRPEARVMGADTGQFRERYVYVDRTSGRRTFILMVNSLVTSSQTLTQ